MEGEVKQKNIDIDDIIKQLKEVVVSLKDDTIEDDCCTIMNILDNFLDVSRTFPEENIKFTHDDVHVFNTLLTHKSNIIVTKTAKTIAELARVKEGREKCTQNYIVKLLMNLLKEDNIDCVTQACRALGNICYENDVGSKMVQDNDGLNLVLDVLEKSVSMKNDEGAAFLRYVAAGFLLNSLADQAAALEQKVLQQKVVPIICDILEIDGAIGGNSAMHALLILETLSDNDRQILDERLAKILISILNVDIFTELSELCLTLLQGQVEYGEVKILLAKSGVCELLLKLLEKNVSECVDEESRIILKTACDFVVLIMTGEESMNLLYADGNGIVYKKLLEWLAMENCDEDLLLTAILTMGNFATSDAHCEKMIANDNVHKHLFRLLSSNSNNDGNVRLQHALLSSIRNLAIPPINKKIMLSDGLVDIIYPMLDVQALPVAFKLLGTLRIVIDGQKQAATSLGMRDGLLKRVIEWCNTDTHLGVQAEANRLIAWLIINSLDEELIFSVINHGAIPHLVKMITVPQALMQNEALLSLTIVSAAALNNCEDALMSSDVIASLETFLTLNVSNLELPIIENALTLLNRIIKSDNIKNKLKESQIIMALKKCQNEKEWSKLMKEKVDSLCNFLDN